MGRGPAWCGALWLRKQLKTGQRCRLRDTLTAHSGGGQTNALALTGIMNRITTVAAGGDSVVLPVSLAGMEITVINAAASNSMNVFPSAADNAAAGGKINALSANAAFAVAAGKTAVF